MASVACHLTPYVRPSWSREAARPDSAPPQAWLLSQSGRGRAHSLWWNPVTGAVEAVPRHTEIPEQLVRKDLPEPLVTRDRHSMSRPSAVRQ